MNGKNFSTHYRQNSYKKRRRKAIIIITSMSVIALFVLFLFIGGVLNDRAGSGIITPSGTNTSEDARKNPEVASVQGYAISLSDTTTLTLQSKISEIRAKNGTGISFSARDASGKEIYYSSIAQSMGKQVAQSPYISISDISQRAINSRLNVSVGVDILSFSVSSDINRSVALAYDAAVCAELSRGGADDVFIRLADNKIDDSNIEELLRFADAVKSIEPSAKIGICLSKNLLEGQNAELIISRLWEKFDLFTYDITAYTEGVDGYEYAESCVPPTIHYYLLRYNMRVLLPSVDTEIFASMTSALSDKGIQNWQSYIPSK